MDSPVVTGPVIAVDPTDSATVYVGTQHGVYKSADGGGSCRRPPTAALEGGFVSSLAIAPASGQARPAIYVGLASGGASWGVFRSTDGGASWVAKDEGLPQPTFVAAFRVAVDRGTPSRIYVASPVYPGTIFTSADGADTWTPCGPGGFPVSTGAPGVVYTSTARSFDSGTTWVPTRSSAPLALAVAPSPSWRIRTGRTSPGRPMGRGIGQDYRRRRFLAERQPGARHRPGRHVRRRPPKFMR